MSDPVKIVFIGDSITEEGRFDDPEGIGFGYVRLIRDYLITEYPDKTIEVFNRGVGGNRIPDLERRWKEDVLRLNPDYVSVSIGINDVWRQIDQPDLEQVYPETFREIYSRLIEQTKRHTKAELILMEPSVHQEDLSSEGNRRLKPYVQIVRDLAGCYGTLLVPIHERFAGFLSKTRRHRLTTDGVHMTSLGDMLIAKTWLEAFLQKVRL